MSLSPLERCQIHEGKGLRSSDDTLVLERAQGVHLFDYDGKRYLDFTGLFAVANVGHGHPVVVEAVVKQAQDLMHCPSANPSRVRAEFYEALASIAPVGLTKILPAITGAMANETAIRIAETRRPNGAIVSFSGSYFGRSPGIVGLAGKSRYREALGLPASGQFLPYPFEGARGALSGDNVIETLEVLAGAGGGLGEVAAVIVEPVQGNGGVVIPPSDFLPRLREFCDRTGALLIVDEIQSGCGRAGKMWAIEHSGITPDLMTVGKGIGGGMAVAAILSKPEFMTWQPDSYSSTFLTNQVNLAAAVAAIKVLKDESLVDRSQKLGERALDKLKLELQGLPGIEEVRGIGLWVAVDFGYSEKGGPKVAAEILRKLQDNGLIASGGGYGGQVVKIAPPLVIGEADLEEGLDIMVRVIRDVLDRAA